MSDKYALSCSQCSATLEVETRQAGQPVNCPQCGQSQEAPRLGALRQLPLISSDTPEAPTSSRGSGMFVAAILLLILGLGGGGGLYLYGKSKLVDYNVDGAMDRIDEEVDALAPTQIVLLFEQMNVDAGLGDWQEQPHVAQSREGRILMGLAIPVGLLGLVGLGLMVFSLRRR